MFSVGNSLLAWSFVGFFSLCRPFLYAQKCYISKWRKGKKHMTSFKSKFTKNIFIKCLVYLLTPMLMESFIVHKILLELQHNTCCIILLNNWTRWRLVFKTEKTHLQHTFFCDAPEVFCGLRNFTRLPIWDKGRCIYFGWIYTWKSNYIIGSKPLWVNHHVLFLTGMIPKKTFLFIR